MEKKLQEALDLNGQFNQDIAIIFGLTIAGGIVAFLIIRIWQYFKKGGHNELL